MQTTSPNLTTLASVVVRSSWRRSRRARHTLTSRRASALAPFALAGLLMLTVGMTPGRPSDAPQAQAHAATSSLSSAVVLAAAADQADMRAQGVSLHYQRGYSVQSGWLCYGWPSGAYHCTQHWYRDSSGRYISLNSGWVPSQTSAGGASVTMTSFSVVVSAKPANNSYPWGECTYGAAQLAHDNVMGLGNARDWLANARARGLPTGTTPRIGATVTFQPFVQGASWLGHVGHVVALGANGSFLMEAMNDDAGFGRYAFRWVHVGAGVAFIY